MIITKSSNDYSRNNYHDDDQIKCEIKNGIKVLLTTLHLSSIQFIKIT